TPLNGILAYGEILVADAATLQPNEIAEMGEVIHQSGRRLERLIENFLIYAQIELLSADPAKTHLLRGKPTEAPAKPIEEQSRNDGSEAGRTDDLQLKLGNWRIPVSEEYLSKIAGELVHNAFKFSQAGTTVSVALTDSPEGFVLTVSDHGRGFSAENISK